MRISRQKTIEENISVFSKLSPSEKIRRVEKSRKTLGFFRKLRVVKDAERIRPRRTDKCI